MCKLYNKPNIKPDNETNVSCFTFNHTVVNLFCVLLFIKEDTVIEIVMVFGVRTSRSPPVAYVEICKLERGFASQKHDY